MQVQPLDDRHDRAAFECGVEQLDRYFRTQASQDTRRRVASCFVLVESESIPLAFYTLAATSVELSDLPPPVAKRLPRYPLVPATLLGRLAVDHRHRGRRLGEHMLMDAFARTLRSEVATFAILVDAKDETASGFYSSYGFRRLTASALRLFIPMSDVARLFA